MRDSWISIGMRSRGSSFAFPLDLGVGLEELTRELRGARTKEVSAINEGSSWTALNNERVGFASHCTLELYVYAPSALEPRRSKSWSMPFCGSLLLRTEAMVPVIWMEMG